MSFAKTEAGRQEIEARTRRLPTALRSILLMIDGQRTDTELRSLIEGLKAPPDALEQLVEMGLIADGWNVAAGVRSHGRGAAGRRCRRSSGRGAGLRRRAGIPLALRPHERCGGTLPRAEGLFPAAQDRAVHRCGLATGGTARAGSGLAQSARRGVHHAMVRTDAATRAVLRTTRGNHLRKGLLPARRPARRRLRACARKMHPTPSRPERSTPSLRAQRKVTNR